MATLNSNEGSKKALRKGPWTPEEDEILFNYVRRNGVGNWNFVAKNTRLNRCPKSCRLRWMNNLRPGLIKGPFTAQEEAIVVDLQSKIGNKWAKMTSRLPGRTDNEIKNFWSTRKKKRARAGLPLYHEMERPQPPMISINHSLYHEMERPQPPMISINHSSISSPLIYDIFNSSRMLSNQPPPQPFGNMAYVPYYNKKNTFFGQSINIMHSQNNEASVFNGQFESCFNFNQSLSIPPLSSNTYNPLFQNNNVNANDVLMEDFNQRQQNNDYLQDYEGERLNSLSFYEGENLIQENVIHGSTSSLSPIWTQFPSGSSMGTSVVDSNFINAVDNFPLTGGPMPGGYYRAGPVLDEDPLPFYGDHAAMLSGQELLNPSMEMTTSKTVMGGSTQFGLWN